MISFLNIIITANTYVKIAVSSGTNENFASNIDIPCDEAQFSINKLKTNMFQEIDYLNHFSADVRLIRVQYLKNFSFILI